MGHQKRIESKNNKITLSISRRTLWLSALFMVVLSSGIIFGYFFHMEDIFSLITWVIIWITASLIIGAVASKIIE